MKRKNKLIASLLLGSVCALALAACGDKDAHKHDYGEAIPQVDATCTTDGMLEHYHCDGCDKDFVKENDKYVKKSAAELAIASEGHSYTDANDSTCNVCGEARETATYNVWDGTTAGVPAAAEGVITITTAEQLAGLAKSVNEGNTYEGVTVKLGVDIDLQNKEWTPIGYGMSSWAGAIETGARFEGTFDGQGNTVYNLKITSFKQGGAAQGTSAGIALFGQLWEATIKDLTVDTAEVTGNHYVAALAGFTLGTTIDNCHVKNVAVDCVYANSNESGDKAAALVAFIGAKAEDWGMIESSAVTNCTASNSTVKADRDAGQIIGCLASDATQSGNTATGVTVSWNQSGSTEGKSNTNISNAIIGRSQL